MNSNRGIYKNFFLAYSAEYIMPGNTCLNASDIIQYPISRITSPTVIKGVHTPQGLTCLAKQCAPRAVIYPKRERLVM